MCIDTNESEHWHRFHTFAVRGVWLVLITLIAFALASACSGPNPPPPPTSGSISLTWSIIDAAGRPSTCDQVGARSVAFRLRPRAGGDVIATAMPCATSPGTAQVAAGVYDITIELHAADGTRLATTPDQTGISIAAGRVTRLTPVRFAVELTSRLVVSIATSATTNCQSAARGGAGITGTTVTLERTDPGRGGCAAVTFSRALGTTQRGTYTVDCTSPAVATCIEKTETLTTSVPPGTYLIHVRGKSDAVDCWQRDDTITVPASSRPTTHTVGLLHVNGPGC